MRGTNAAPRRRAARTAVAESATRPDAACVAGMPKSSDQSWWWAGRGFIAPREEAAEDAGRRRLKGHGTVSSRSLPASASSAKGSSLDVATDVESSCELDSRSVLALARDRSESDSASLVSTDDRLATATAAAASPKSIVCRTRFIDGVRCAGRAAVRAAVARRCTAVAAIGPPRAATPLTSTVRRHTPLGRSLWGGRAPAYPTRPRRDQSRRPTPADPRDPPGGR